MARSYALFFDGYHLGAAGLPAKSGIYCVYACTHDSGTNTVSIRKLLYIGESANVRNRVDGHERRQVWERELQRDEVLCFSTALITPESDRRRAEAAMIYRHKPPCNVEYVHSFPYEQTTISTSGQNAQLHQHFTVYKAVGSEIGALLGGRGRW